MKVSGDELSAVGRVLAQLKGEVTSARLGGREISADLAISVYEAQKDTPRSKPWKAEVLVDQLTDRLDERIQQAEGWVQGTRVGRAVAGFLAADPTRVEHETTLEVTTSTGQKLEIPIVVMNPRAHKLLQRLGLCTALATTIPVLGYVVPPATAVVSGLAAVVAKAAGEGDLASALRRVSARNVVLTGACFIPVVSESVALIAAANANRHRKAGNEAPSLAELDLELGEAQDAPT